VEKFIAVRKRTRSAAFALHEAATAAKRMELMRDAQTSRRAMELIRLGLRPHLPGRRKPVGPGFERLGHVSCYIVNAPTSQQAEQAREVLADDYLIVPDVSLSLPVARVGAETRVRRPRAPEWPAISGIQEAHSRGIRGRNVIVGVLDTGCDADHNEFLGKRIEFRYVPFVPTPESMRAVSGFDTHGHGTHVCGIIAGRNVGVAPDVDLLAAAVVESETVKTSLERIVVALDWMLSHFSLAENQDKPMIISMSLGFRPEWISAPAFKTVTEGMQLLLRTLVEDFDVLPIIAIGNDGPGVVRAPGSYAEALGVGAVDFDLNPWSSSSSGQTPDGRHKPDIVGFGVNIMSSLERDLQRRSLYARMSGTSMAAPYVAGIAALIASANPGLQGAALRQRLLETTLPLSAPAERVGAGLARFVL
jgi:subtilisin family serine protease